ncbi:hypothetical protein DRQ07_02175 [candidate division KSB1 bacterium]|nr:MAG: hypothetical protein DRQ07_02175 [candidate division KSB1 bacterium]
MPEQETSGLLLLDFQRFCCYILVIDKGEKMSVRKWIISSVFFVLISVVVILIVTTGLMKWRKKVNYPPSSDSIVAKAQIEFLLQDADKNNSDGYKRFYPVPGVVGFLSFQSALDRNNLSVSNVRLLIQDGLYFQKSGKSDFTANSNVKMLLKAGDSPVVSLYCDSLLNSEPGLSLQALCKVKKVQKQNVDLKSKEISEAFLKEILNGEFIISFTFKRSDEKEIYTIQKVVLKLL